MDFLGAVEFAATLSFLRDCVIRRRCFEPLDRDRESLARIGDGTLVLQSLPLFRWESYLYLLHSSFCYVIKQSFRYLYRVVKVARLGHYWRSVWKRLGHGSRKLSESQVEWIVRAKEHGTSSKDIASALQSIVSVRRIEQIYALYRKSGQVPAFGNPGRPRVEIPADERAAIRYAHIRFKVGAVYLVPVLKRYYSINTNHMRVYQVMREEGLLYSKARKRFRRKWVRYEREFSNELWHVDWHEMEDARWKGMQLIVYEDDTSRRIMAHGVFEHATSPHSVEVLKRAIAEHEKPESILDDRGSTFYAVESEARKKGLTEFELFLMSNHIQQILSGVRHPQTNGKLEKLFDILETGLARGISSIDDCMYWYNCERPHGALDLERAETPIEAYYRKLPQRDILIDPSSLLGGEMIS